MLLRIFTLLILVLLAGCSSPSSEDVQPDSPSTVELQDLNVLVIGDLSLEEPVRRQWSARKDAVAKLTSKSEAEFAAEDFRIPDGTDVVIYPPHLLGELLAEEQLQELPDSILDDADLNRKEILRHSRTSLARVGNRTWALPLGTPNLVLMYRSDVLTALDAQPPTTWEEFQAVAERLRSAGELKNENGETLPTRLVIPLADGWRSRILLASAAPLIRSRGKISTLFNRNDMSPLIDSEPFQVALEGLRDCCQDYDLLKQETPASAYAKLLAGEAAMVVGWPSRAFEPDPSAAQNANLVSVTPLPGSNRWFDMTSGKWNERDSETSRSVPFIGFDGLIASMPTRGTHQLSAIEFMKWLPGKTISIALFSPSPHGGPFRASHLGNPMEWTGDNLSPEAAEEYATIVNEINEESVVVQLPRIPGLVKYLNALDVAMDQALGGDVETETALQDAAKRWDELTDELGRDNQRYALRRHHEY